MFWRSSGIRITATIMALFVLASVLVVGAVLWQTNEILTRHNVASVVGETRTLSEIAARDGTASLLAAMRERASRNNGMIYGLADRRGQTQWLGGLDAWPAELERDNKTGVFEYEPRPGRSAIHPAQSTGSALAIGATLRLPGGHRLLVARDVTDQRDLATNIRNWFFAGLVFLAALAIAAGWAINRFLMARIDAMTQTTSSIMAGDLSKRVPLTDSDDEFDALADNLNAMLDRIESLMHGLREVSDNIAHDLKTPLSRLRIRAEEALRDPRGDAACREGLEATLVEADELMRTFNALLRVARLEAGTLGDNLEVFEVAALIRDLAEFYEPVVDEAGAEIRIDAVEPLYLRADRQLISQALTNLIENALKYGLDNPQPDSARHITIGAAKSSAGADLWVSDHGKGINRTDHERVLKRFVRLDEARSKPGTGLGLSLVAAVVRQHGGKLQLVDNDPGLKVMLHLPAARVAPEGAAIPAGPDCQDVARHDDQIDKGAMAAASGSPLR
ncbi:MAG: HAMP domain-containing histidine kinase [Alphaproteobacteria bacterium]|nr:HAMP domain-containing histidine kinase [Alphaproteobacteria bacterium]